MSQLTDFTFVDLFPTLKDFNVDALKWTDLEEGVVHQIVSTRVVNTQHGQSTVLSLQKEDGTSYTVCVCGMLSAELLSNPMLLVNLRLLSLLGRRRARHREESIILIYFVICYLKIYV